MTFINKITILFLLIIVNQTVIAQDDEYFNENFIRYENHIYDDNIKTVQLFRKGWNEAFPVVNLNEYADQVHLTFDDLNDNFRNLGYTFIHCSYDWEPSDLMKIEYLNGIEDNTVEKYGFSSTLYQPYVKYDLSFPNRDVSFSKSGNYLLLVYDMDNNNELLITWRFFVVEYYANVIPNVHRATQAQYRQNSHEVDFTINQNNIQLIQPFSSLKVIVTQNQDWDGAIKDLAPRYIRGTSLIYDYDEENIFPAGNEFRVIDIRNINYNSMTTSHINTINDSLNAFIFTDKPRSSKVYLTTPDINGHYYLKNDDVRFDSDLEMEYMKVNLSLEYPAKVYKGGIYIYGQLTGWQLNEHNKMHWNPKTMKYEISLYLKQGYYNYQYMYKSDNSEEGDIAIIEGSHAEADNEYSFFVYYREPGQVYDRLIGYNTVIYPVYNLDK